MITRILALLCTMAFSVTATAAESVTKRATTTETYAVSSASPRLHVSNIWGTVKVRPGPAGEIRVTIDETRSAPNQELFDRSLDTLRLDVAADAAGVSFHVGDREERWQRHNQCRHCRVDFQFDIQVPPGTIVDVGTVMDGKVDVDGMTGQVTASNVNGPVSVNNISNCESIESVNGRIDIGFNQAPTLNCKIETINGDITLNVPADSSIDIALDLFNGRVKSELDVETFTLPATVSQVESDGKTRYQVQQLAGLRLGAGGPVYSIASMNGDLKVKKNQ